MTLSEISKDCSNKNLLGGSDKSYFRKIEHRLKKHSQKIYFINHFSKDNKINLARILRNSWINEENLKKENLAIFVYGEFSSIETVENVLDFGFDSLVIFGDCICSDTKDGVIELKSKYKEKLRIFSFNNQRPPYHSTLIGRNILFENMHEPNEEYTCAKIIENAEDIVLKQYKEKIFDYLMDKNIREVNHNDLVSMNTCST